MANRMTSPTVTRSSVKAFLITDYLSNKALRKAVRAWKRAACYDTKDWDNMAGVLFHAIPIGGENGVFMWGAKPEAIELQHYCPNGYISPLMAKADRIICCYPNFLPKEYRMRSFYPKGVGEMQQLAFTGDRLESDLKDVEDKTGGEPKDGDWITIKLIPGYGVTDMENARWKAYDRDTLEAFAKAHPLREYAITYGNYKRLPPSIRESLEDGRGKFGEKFTVRYDNDYLIRHFALIRDPGNKMNYYLFPDSSPEERLVLEFFEPLTAGGGPSDR